MSATGASVEGLVPFVQVRDVVRSASFYELFGFEVGNTYDQDGRRVWCWLERHHARFMLARGAPPACPSRVR